MIRFQSRSANDMEMFRDRLQGSLPRFLAYCAVLRACRHVPQFRLGKPVVVALVVPDPAEFDAYLDGARFAAVGSEEIYGRSESTAFISRRRGNSKRSANEELESEMRSKSRVVLVAEDRSAVPEMFAMVADAVVEVARPEARHVAAGAWLCLNLRVSPEDAEFMAGVPLSVLAGSLRRGRAVSVAMKMMRQAVRPRARDVSGPSLEDLHGLGEAGEWGRDLARDLADWRAGRIGWADVDRGALISGPPGVGKTVFAQALARSCDVHLVLGSIGRWQAKGHLGDMLKAMRAAFDEARAQAPSIIFLDEIDAVGDREKFNDRNAQYSTEVVNALLECMDGAEGREGVVVVGACNHPHRLDAALTRAGRLDRHIRIPLPDRKAREGILRWHLSGALPGADLSEVSSVTEGWNGASLEQLVRQARRRARRDRRDLQVADLLASLPERVRIPESLRRRTAVHEAGHAIVVLVLGVGELVSVAVEDSVLADAAGFQDGGGVNIRDNPVPDRTRAWVLNGIAVRLGGIAAEEVLLGERSAGAGGAKGSDLHSATLSALTFEASYGLGESFAYLAADDEGELFDALRFDRFLRERVDRVLESQFERARRIVQAHRPEVERLADALMKKGRLSGDEVRDLVSRQPRLMLAGGGGRG